MFTSSMNLEFDKIIAKLKTYASTSLGVQGIEEINIITDADLIEQLLSETDEVLSLLYRIGEIPFGGISDIRPHIKRAKIGGILSSQELLAISHFIYGVAQMILYLEKVRDHRIEIKYIAQYFEQLVNLKELRKKINACIDDYGQVVDSASDELYRIRQGIKTQEMRIKEKLQSIIQTRKDVLTESLVTMRNDRYVVPVRVDYKNQFPGIVHDTSQSGNTVYIEPQSVVEANNKLNALLHEEKQEIERILKQLTAEVAVDAQELEKNVALVKTLDVISAKAKYAKATDSIKPEINTDGIIKLYRARHPLISPERVVSNDIFLGQDYQCMIITGPNTGGKTVTLKTVGLLTLMMQAGLLIPANPGSVLAVFDNVFSDIGDEQSIEQSLSTFSSHMKNIVTITNQITLNSLVLFDELGAGTDPKEGAALAMAIIDFFLARGARIIATTHYSELKTYAYNKEKVVNASVEFDVNTLSPTYKLLIGVPGRSNALEISTRLGLRHDIIEQARQKVETEHTDATKLIQKLEDQGLYLEKLIAENQALNEQLKQERAQLEAKLNELNEQRTTIFEKARREAQTIVEQARKESEDVIQELKELKKLGANIKDHEIIAIKSKLNQQYAQPQETYDTNTELLKPGALVKVLSLGHTGTLIEAVNDKEWLVQVGIMTSRVPIKQLKVIETEQPESKRKTTQVRVVKAHKGSMELDLRGERYEDAMRKLEQFIDQALLNNFHQVSIIHGHGTGALRKGVQNFLKTNPYVADYRYGGEGEGGLGVTVVTFK